MLQVGYDSKRPAGRASEWGGFPLSDTHPVRQFADERAVLSLYRWGDERVYVVDPKMDAASANLLWIHGLSDHLGRQLETARHLAGAGVRTILFDLAGHGSRSLPEAQSWGRMVDFFAHPDEPEGMLRKIRAESEAIAWNRLTIAVNQRDELVETRFGDHLEQLNRILSGFFAKPWKSLPTFVFGHSFGGILALEMLRRQGPKTGVNWAGLVLMSPAFEPAGRRGQGLESALASGGWQFLQKGRASRLFRPVSRVLSAVDYDFDVTWGNQFVSDQPAENLLVDEDPLNRASFPTPYLGPIIEGVLETEQKDWSFLPDTLLLLPGRDGIVRTEASLRTRCLRCRLARPL